MKKVLLFLTCCFLFVAANYANDTLTRAQVYNFNVGDTFDYKFTYISTIPYWEHDSYDFQRQVIEDTFMSALSDTLFIARKIIYSNQTTTSISFFK